jgi:hypothetical protein
MSVDQAARLLWRYPAPSMLAPSDGDGGVGCLPNSESGSGPYLAVSGRVRRICGMGIHPVKADPD